VTTLADHLNLRWRATRIAGEVLENDGVCMDGEAGIGRVRLHEYGFKPPEWHWSMYADAPGVFRDPSRSQGKADTKDEAKAAVEVAYAHFVAATPDARACYQKAAREMRERAELFEARRSGRADPIWPRE
jgi:hypothetical protein